VYHSASPAMWRVLACSLLVADVRAQLRPRRVGVNPLGDSEPADGGFDESAVLAKLQAMKAEAAGAAAPDLEGMEGMEDQLALLQKMMSGEQGDMTEALQGLMQNNPMVQAMLESNPEMAEMLNPEKLQENMAKVTEMMGSPEGQEQMQQVGAMMQEVLTDPEKMRKGIEEFMTNPALAGMADALPPEVKQMMQDPAAMQGALEEIQRQMGDGDLMANMAENMAKMMQGMGGAGDLSSLMGQLGSLGDEDGQEGSDSDPMRV